MANDTIITVFGNLTDDPELKFVKDGNLAVVNFTVASTPRSFDQPSGKWVNRESMFLKCGAFRDLAEHIAESLRKGMRVIVSGRLRQHHWDTPEGEKRSMFVLDVDEIGPSLVWATATVTKAARANGNTNSVSPSSTVDPWTGDTRTPVGASAGGAMSTEPPF